MWLASLHRLLLGKSRSSQVRHGRSHRPRFRPTLDYLEERIALSNITVGAGDTAGLIAAINQANTDGSGDTISLTNSQYTLNQVNNTTNGANALPVITAANLTINGNGATISAAYLARVLDLASGAGVTLEDLTITGGLATGAKAQGAAIYDAGNNLTLKTVTIASNSAAATGQTAKGAGNSAQGGGLYISGGTVHLTNSNITENVVSAATGAAGASGGAAQGGGIYANGATLIVSGGAVKDETLEGGYGGSGTANKPTGGAGGNAQGGGIYAEGGSVTLSKGATVSNNTVRGHYGANAGSGGAGGAGGNAEGGGVYTSNAVLVINSGANANDNSAFGGGGGAGNGSGQGGAGGQAFGGGVFVKGGKATISGSAYVNDNVGSGGNGGTGGAAGAGGVGGAAEGGGVYVLAAPLTLTSGTGSFSPSSVSAGVLLNTVRGGRGADGGGISASGSGNGGAGGAAQGGGVFASGSNLAVNLGNATTAAAVDLNTAIGGDGGTAGSAGGVGGNAGSITGGGVSVLGDQLTVVNLTVYGNTGTGGNGGNGEFSAHGYVVGGSFGNGGNAQGAGVFVSGSSSVTVLNSTITDGVANGGGSTTGGVAKGIPYGIGGTAQGGGLDAVSSTVSVLNSTVADNVLYAGTGSAPSTAAATGKETAQGGGLFAANGSLTLINDTIAWNDVASYTDLGQILGLGGGVYNASSSTLHLANTIIALNQQFSLYKQGGTQYGSASDTENDLYDTVATSDHDFIGNGSGSTLINGSNGDQVGSAGALLNPQFAPALTTNSFGALGSISGQLPANYGGLTYTLPLTASSSALNAGDASTSAGSPVALIAAAENVATANATDQRGMPRVINGDIDIGATQSGLLLSGIAPATVQAGQDITYTLTISNNGPSSLSSVTLTDALPANTTFVSLAAPAGWSTSTPSGGGTGTVTASIATLAADTTATFTLVVQVNASAQGVTIVNSPKVSYVGTANPVSSNLTLSTAIPGAAGTNITNKVGLLETPIIRDPFAAPGTYVQAAMFINESGAAINGPIAFVLNGLPAGVTVTNANGTYNGSPYINIEPPGGTWLPGVRYFLYAVVTFSDPTHVKITYTPEVVQGI